MGKEIRLRDKDVYPNDELLASTLGESYGAYREMMKVINSPARNINLEWRFYNDGKAWLGKIVHKKKTLFWLSVWEGFFKCSFHFTEKSMYGVSELDIDEKIKEDFRGQKFAGKLIPLIIDIYDNSQIEDLIKIIEYKKSLK